MADVCLGALALALPGRLGGASQGTMNNTLIGGTGWVYYETVGGGQGARPGRAGMSGVHTGMTNTKNTPVEALERAFPMRVRRYRLRRGSGGEGAAPGGEGIERDLEMLEDVTVSLITERRIVAAVGRRRRRTGRHRRELARPRGRRVPRPNASPTSARCTCGPATSSACSPPAAAAGAATPGPPETLGTNLGKETPRKEPRTGAVWPADATSYRQRFTIART